LVAKKAMIRKEVMRPTPLLQVLRTYIHTSIHTHTPTRRGREG